MFNSCLLKRLSKIACALDEFANRLKKLVSFTSDAYKSVYEAMLRIMANIREDSYQSFKFTKYRGMLAQHGL